MSEVWRGAHREQGLPVAVKVMSPELADRPAARAALETEVRAVAALDHPGVVMVFDYGLIPPETEAASNGRLEAHSPYLVMELATGPLIRPAAGRTWVALRRVLLQLLDALAHAHARGVIHRDIKPGNVLYGSAQPGREGYKLTDFGLAHAMERQGSHRVGGTLMYMAPEQFRGAWRDFGPWTDLYSFGCLAWELTCGRPPFTGDEVTALRAAHLSRVPPPLTPLMAVPEGYDSWLHRLLVKHPRDRFLRAADAACALVHLGVPVGEAAPLALPPLPGLETIPAFGSAVTWTDELPARSSVPRALPPPPEIAHAPVPVMPDDWRAPEPPAGSVQLAGVGLGIYGLRTVRMVGRELERDRLWRSLRAVREDRLARVVIITGEAGVGKSRLARWLAERAHELGAGTVLRGTYGPERGPVDGLGPMLARHLRCAGLERGELSTRLESVAREVGEVDPSFWGALEVLVAPESVGERKLSAVERFSALARFLEASSRRSDGEVRPRVVWIDDAQWGGDALAFAEHLLGQREDRPVLVLLTIQEEALVERPFEGMMAANLMARAGAEILRVGPLGDDERKELVRGLLGLEGPLAATVAARSAGNPLFAVQLVGDWVQRQALETKRSGFGLREGAWQSLPDNLHAVWQDRVERLLADQPEAVGQALELAAALGLRVDIGEWQAACGEAGLPVGVGLADLLLRRRLARVTGEGWGFVHEMLRASIARRAREAGRARDHHGACARTLARLYPSEHPGLAERLGRHLEMAGDPGAAVGPLLTAASERKEVYALDMARALLRRREALMHEARIPESDERWGDGWALSARICVLQGELDEALTIVQRANEVSKRYGWTRIQAEALRAWSHALSARGQRAEAATLTLEALALFESLGDEVSAGESQNWLGFVAQKRGDLEAATDWSRAAMTRFVALDNKHGQADAHWVLGHVALQRAEMAEASARFACARDLFTGLGRPLKVANVLNDLAEVHRHTGDFDAAEEDYRSSLAISRRVGGGQAVVPRINLALMLLARDRWEAAAAELRLVQAELHSQGRRGYLPYAVIGLLVCDVIGEDYDAYTRRLEEARGVIDGVKPDRDLAWLTEMARERAMGLGWSPL